MKELSNSVIVCVIPTLNEAITVSDVVLKAKRFADRVIVVDGHSQDGTPEMASKSGAVVLFQEGRGKGMALRTVFNRIYGDIYVTIDGDATYDALEMDKLLQPILDGKADMVVGSRLAGEMQEGAITRINKLGNVLFNKLINFRFNTEITDSQSGFRALNRNAIEILNLETSGFEIETEMTVEALRRGLRIVEIPIRYSRRVGTPSKLSSFKAGSRILKVILGSYFRAI